MAALAVQPGVIGSGSPATTTRANMHQHVGALSRGDQQLLHLLHGAQLDAVVGDNIQPVLVELQQHVVLVL